MAAERAGYFITMIPGPNYIFSPPEIPANCAQWSILYPPPLSPVRLRQTPPESHRTPPVSARVSPDFTRVHRSLAECGGTLAESGGVRWDSGGTPVESSGKQGVGVLGLIRAEVRSRTKVRT